MKNIKNFYKKNYKKLMILPILLLLVSFGFMYIAMQDDGTPLYRGISLKGGLSANVYINTDMGTPDLKKNLRENFPAKEFTISELVKNEERVGFIIDTNLDEDKLKNHLKSLFNTDLQGDNYSSNYISPTLSNSFFIQAMWILLISFILMSVVVFAYFREKVPAFAIILSAFFDIVVTVGALNTVKHSFSIAGIGSLLMLIGYSIDTDILLTNRLIRETGKNYMDRIKDAFKTGATMSATTAIAGLIAFLFSNSEVIREVALILVVGIIVDFISTWVQNTGILLWWMEKKNT